MPTVLIADNHPHTLLTLKYLVEKTGQAGVIVAENGPDAVRLAVQHRPELVIMSVGLPGMDGYAACKAIRDVVHDRRGHIWFITSRHQVADLDQARQVGADRLINKPFDPDQLVTDIRALLDQVISTQAA